MTNNNENNEKIEDILKSVRNIIDNHNSRSTQPEPAKAAPPKEHTDAENILELTSIIEEKDINKDSLISEQVKIQAREEINKFINTFKQEYSTKFQSMELIVNDLMRPLIKDWLNNNLPTMVEKIVSEEIKKIIPK